MNDKSVLDGVADVAVVTKTSKAGNPYNVLRVTFTNNYSFEAFLNSEASFIISRLTEE